MKIVNFFSSNKYNKMISSYEEKADMESDRAARGKKVALSLLFAIFVILVVIIIYMTYSQKHSITYSQTQTGIWFQEKAKDYTCPKASGVQTQGDWANYCIFTKEDDAKAACTADTTCIGYGEVADGSMFQLTRLPPVPNTAANGRFLAKQSS